jgi:hypothetical protein
MTRLPSSGAVALVIESLLRHTIHTSDCVQEHLLDDDCSCGLKSLEIRARRMIVKLRRLTRPRHP